MSRDPEADSRPGVPEEPVMVKVISGDYAVPELHFEDVSQALAWLRANDTGHGAWVVEPGREPRWMSLHDIHG